jgi:hypothetical protein
MLVEKIGEKSRREMLVALVSDAPYGSVLGYDTIADAIGAEDKATVQAAVNGSLASIGRELSKTLVNVRGVGYRVPHPNEHVDVGRSRRGRMARQGRKGKAVTTYVDLSAMTKSEATATVSEANKFAEIDSFMRRQKKFNWAIANEVARVEGDADRKLANLQVQIDELKRKSA